MTNPSRDAVAGASGAPVGVADYHERTKHRFDGYARGPETIDWDRQPDPFRRFDGAPLLPLPRVKEEPSVPFAALSAPQTIPPRALTLSSLACLLEHSLALSARKQYGSARWSLRCNPSSGNLHPTEAYLLSAGIGAVEDGVYHYRSDLHALERRCRFSRALAGNAPELMIGLSSVHWREAWKYGERAYRYCQLDVGHAAAALAYAAAMLGWRIEREERIGDTQLAALLGLDRAGEFIAEESETPDLLLRVITGSAVAGSVERWLHGAAGSEWRGKAATLDPRHFYRWPIIDAVTAACLRPAGGSRAVTAAPSLPPPMPGACAEPIGRLIRRRRSAQAFDGATPIAREDFYRLLDHLLPRSATAPWSVVPAPAAAHLILFVHRVTGLVPGLYAFPRSEQGLAVMRNNLRKTFLWQPLDGAPEHLPLYRLIGAKAERTAARLSCGQSIAGDSAFSLGMLVEFEANVIPHPWRYRELFWEAGAIGQVLYLEAEACGLRGTGIGCFFDDGVHELLGISGRELQSFYHFTVGGPLTDYRIVSLPPYSSLRVDGLTSIF